jgi:hypothetical protein
MNVNSHCFGLGWTTISYGAPPPPGTTASSSNRVRTGSASSMMMRAGSVSKTATRTETTLRMPVRTRSASCMVVWTRMMSRKGLQTGSTLLQPSPAFYHWTDALPLNRHHGTAHHRPCHHHEIAQHRPEPPRTTDSSSSPWNCTPPTRAVVVEPPTPYPTAMQNWGTDGIWASHHPLAMEP